MRYQEIGTSGVNASRVAMGVWFASKGKTQKELERALDTSLELGINFIDTAYIYGDGQSSTGLGLALKHVGADRSKLYLQTKIGIRHDPKRYDLSYEHVIDAVDTELERLQTDYLDFVLIHRYDPLCDVDALSAAFNELHRSGKVRHFGVSNMGPWMVEMLQGGLDERLEVDQLEFGLGHTGPLSAQAHVNLDDDVAIDRDGGVIPYCQCRHMTIQAWSPFKRDMRGGSIFDADALPELNAKLDELASSYGTSKEAIACAWILRHPAGIQVLSGSSNPEHIRNVAAGADIDLSRVDWYGLYVAAGNDIP